MRSRLRKSLTAGIIGCAMVVPALAQDTTTAETDVPTAEEIMMRSVAAMGGEAWDSVNSMSFTVVPPAELMGEAAIRAMAMRPDKIRCNMEIPEFGTAYAVANGAKMWIQDPMGGDPQTISLADGEAHIFRVLAAQPFFFMAKGMYPDWDAEGVEEFGGAKCYAIDAETEDESSDIMLYFNVETGLYAGFTFDGDGESLIFNITEYKEMDGRQLITKATMESDMESGAFEFKDFSFNDVDETVFAVPDGLVFDDDDAAGEEDDDDDDDDDDDEEDDDGENDDD